MTSPYSKSGNLFGIRLKQARERRGLSMRVLTERMPGGVSAAAISKYEHGKMTPTLRVVEALCGVLEVPEDFFRRPLVAKLAEVKFRCRSSLLAKDEGKLRGEAEDFFERYVELEDLLGPVKEFRNPLAGVVIGGPEDVERAVERLRAEWRLGEVPLQSVVTLLEERHVLVYLADAPKEFDGFAGRAGHREVVALNGNFPVDRMRFSAMHELGHIVLEAAIQHLPSKEQEMLCHRFAGAMLMPRGRFLDIFGNRRKHLDLEELKRVKEIFGISCAAQLKRAEGLGLMAPGTMQQVWMEWSRRGYRKNDPGKCRFVEKPTRFSLLLRRAVAESRISQGKAAMLAGVPLQEFQNTQELLP